MKRLGYQKRNSSSSQQSIMMAGTLRHHRECFQTPYPSFSVLIFVAEEINFHWKRHLPSMYEAGSPAL